ncbi:hypothetical protein AVEN_15439-1 [Araneus ventricosus]|uniref:Lebercilin domain-containing protein n=1 Tax=Araneus ventricosus TaxID=182803 RepID=A0A4Y2CS17_ARAVE|nr:hypothetical protein AVEN_15439-1 [Araneus ventricosus]
MDIGSEVNHINDKDVIHNLKEEKSKFVEFPSEENASKKGNDPKSLSTKKPREADKHKNISSVCNRPMYQRKYFRPPPPLKRKPAPAVSIRMSNPSAKIVLQERQVEIKDLESQVVYLQNQIKELKAENRTLLDVQNRQTKELKKYCGGITDIPALIRSHNDEIKAIQSNASAIRKELRVCQSDLKSKGESILRKDQELNKLKLALKNSEQNLQEMTIGNRKLNRENKKLEDETKKLVNENEELKSKTEKMQKTIQQLTNKMLDLEETLSTAESHKNQLKGDLKELQSKYEEALENEITFKKSLDVPKVVSTTQTEKVETVHVAIMTLEISEEPELLSSEKVSIGVQASQDEINPQCTSMELKETEIIGNNVDEGECCRSAASRDKFTALDIYPDIFCQKESTNSKPPSQARRTGFRKPMYSALSLSQEMPKETPDVKKANRDFTPFSASEMLKKPLGSVSDKKSIPLSNHLHPYNTTTFFTKEPLSKSNTVMDASLIMDINARKDAEDDLSFYFKEATSKSFLRKSSNRIEPSLECNTTGRKDVQNDIRTRILDRSCDTSLKPSNSNKSRNDLFSNLTSKQNTMYPNG